MLRHFRYLPLLPQLAERVELLLKVFSESLPGLQVRQVCYEDLYVKKSLDNVVDLFVSFCYYAKAFNLQHAIIFLMLFRSEFKVI